MIRVPGILAGLKERSQSAYAAPAPNPVDNAMGHVRPVVDIKYEAKRYGGGQTPEQNDRGYNACAETYTAETAVSHSE